MSFNPAITAAAPRLNADVFKSALEAPMLATQLERIALNPQPLPPREEGSLFESIGHALVDDWCGTVPRHWPPPPPPPLSGLEKLGQGFSLF